jgi:tRNA (guanine-N7-)-methyltransferase
MAVACTDTSPRVFGSERAETAELGERIDITRGCFPEIEMSDRGLSETMLADEGRSNEKPDAPLFPDIELIPPDYFAPLDLEKAFGRKAIVEVDLGCGDGGFVAELAARFPERNFLGVERLGGRVLRGCRKVTRLGLKNVRYLRIESSYAVQYLLPAGSVDVVHLLFPDPWPKKKHKRRRIVQPAFLEAVHRMLVPGGRFRIATDQENYFSVICALMSPQLFAPNEPPPDEVFPVTTFERHFVREGAPIHRLDLRKVS